ncbi:MAG: STAS/SEC14 domain-containing protein [Chakrabartia sp.]
MLTVTMDKDAGYLELTVDGPIDSTSYAKATEAVDALLTRHKKIDVVQVIRDLGWIDPSVWRKDLTFHMTHRDFIRHATIVSDSDWIESVSNLLAPLFPADVKSFKLADIEAARKWVRGPAAGTGPQEEQHLDFA